MITSRSKENSILVLSGILLGLAFPPFPFYIFAFFALIPLFFVLSKKKTLIEVNKSMYLFSFVFTLITLYWVGSWTKEADPFLMISGVLLMFFNPILFLIPSTFYFYAKKYVNSEIALLALPFFWVSFEFLYSITEFRFPWLTLGNSLSYFDDFIQIAEFIGVHGLSLIIIFINIFIYKSASYYFSNKTINYQYLILPILLFFIPFFYSLSVSEEDFKTDKKLRIGLIQPNLNPWGKWDAGNLNEQIDLYFNLSKNTIKDSVDLLIFPESALPVYLASSRYSREMNRFHKFVDTNKVSILTGMPDFNLHEAKDSVRFSKPIKNSNRTYTSYNAAYLFQPNQNFIEEYHKTMLVPFGEKIPYHEYIPFISDLFKWEVGISSWNVGSGAKNLILVNKTDSIKIGTVICIESIYPNYVAEFTEQGAEFLTVITNDSWYGRSSGPYQHLAFSKLRAVENRKYIVRVANGGISAVISPTGKILAKTELFTQANISAEIYLNNIKTYFVKFKNVVPILSLGISLLFLNIFLTKKFSRQDFHQD